MYCDLHMHSTASDGTVPPDELPQLARAAGLAAIALTDHDTAAGVSACAAACARMRVHFVPGIELSADPGPAAATGAKPRRAAGARQTQAGDEARVGTLHILGLFIRHDEPKLLAIQERLLAARAQRNPAMVQRLNELGVRIDYEEVVAAAGGTSGGSEGQIVGRPHIAQVLLDKGYVKSIQDAFTRYLGSTGAAYVRKDRLSPGEAIEAIHAAGGLAVLAHPVQLRIAQPARLEYFIARLRELGLDGIETRHSDHTAADVRRLEKIAGKLKLLTSGGSDFHGSRKRIVLGSQKVPLAVYERLREAWENGGRSGAIRPPVEPGANG